MKKLLLATAAVLCFARPATAQEWEKKAPMEQKNSYFAFRMGGSHLNMKTEDEKEKKSLFMMSGAFGTKIYPDVRVEVELTATDTFEKNENVVGGKFEYKHSVGNFSLNVLRDFDARKIKPYIGAGVGFGSFTDEIKRDQTVGFSHFRENKKVTTTVLSGNIQAGVTVALTDTVSVDANARYTHFGDYEVKFWGQKIKMKNNAVDMSVGLRFAF